MNKNIEIKELNGELDRVMEIWLNSNIDAHYFIDKDYWQDNFEIVKSTLPDADVKIACLEKEVVGFMGIVDGYIAGIFVEEKKRGLGIGSRLLEEAIKSYTKLSLDVYKKNKSAYEFYINKGFKIVEEKQDEENGEVEYSMAYESN